MTFRRCLDLTFALLLAGPVLVVLCLLWLIVVPLQGRPFIFASERMRRVDQPFHLYKIRTMHPVDPGGEQSVLGGDQSGRVTRIGKFLRKTRLDELPQIWNVLKGDIGFIGPRPPLRRYVTAYPELYAEVLQTRPGITGLATVMLHRREEQLLSRCDTPMETDRVYREYCIPPKVRLDRFYRTNHSVLLDLWILYLTIARVVPPILSFRRQDFAGVRRRDRGELATIRRSEADTAGIAESS